MTVGVAVPEWTGTVIERVTFGQALRDTAALAGRGLTRFRHNPHQLVDVIVVPIVFTIMFANIFGGAVSGSVTDYLPQLVPGVAVSVAVTTSVITGVQLREDMDTGVFDRFISLPIARVAPLAGLLIADTFRYLIATVVSLTVGVALGYRPDSVIGALAATLLTVFAAFSISWIFALMGVLMSKASAVQGISMLILMPLTFTSNAYVPTETMPGWMQRVADVNPVSHLVSAYRDLADGLTVSADLGWTLLGTVAIIAIIAPITVRTYLRRV
ncbi:ABC transporter permease [Gordonia sp. CPCC 206044]|uniref:ABC transporter permease n=1 Tax=Gordonia sp. CPCC 206044 TaxID=3140793 RepID=UPI003AF34D85